MFPFHRTYVCRHVLALYCIRIKFILEGERSLILFKERKKRNGFSRFNIQNSSNLLLVYTKPKKKCIRQHYPATKQNE